MCIVLRAKWQNSVISLNLLPSINKVIIIIIIIVAQLASSSFYRLQSREMGTMLAENLESVTN